jgi:hypothetical protein
METDQARAASGFQKALETAMKIRNRMHAEFEDSHHLVRDELEQMGSGYLSSASQLKVTSKSLLSSSASGLVFELPDTSNTPITPAREEFERPSPGKKPVLFSSIPGFPSELADTSRLGYPLELADTSIRGFPLELADTSTLSPHDYVRKDI